jgi:hypothetical protein
MSDCRHPFTHTREPAEATELRISSLDTETQSRSAHITGDYTPMGSQGCLRREA